MSGVYTDDFIRLQTQINGSPRQGRNDLPLDCWYLSTVPAVPGSRYHAPLTFAEGLFDDGSDSPTGGNTMWQWTEGLAGELPDTSFPHAVAFSNVEAGDRPCGCEPRPVVAAAPAAVDVATPGAVKATSDAKTDKPSEENLFGDFDPVEDPPLPPPSDRPPPAEDEAEQNEEAADSAPAATAHRVCCQSAGGAEWCVAETKGASDADAATGVRR